MGRGGGPAATIRASVLVPSHLTVPIAPIVPITPITPIPLNVSGGSFLGRGRHRDLLFAFALSPSRSPASAASPAHQLRHAVRAQVPREIHGFLQRFAAQFH